MAAGSPVSAVAPDSILARFHPFGGNYRLLFVDRNASELCSLTNVTEGEARWIGQIVLHERSAWFR